MMADPTGFFVQFPHPGGEHNPSGNKMPWNTGEHPMGTLRDSWEAVRHQILAANLPLAVWLQTPSCQGSDASVPGTARQRC